MLFVQCRYFMSLNTTFWKLKILQNSAICFGEFCEYAAIHAETVFASNLFFCCCMTKMSYVDMCLPVAVAVSSPTLLLACMRMFLILDNLLLIYKPPSEQTRKLNFSFVSK